MEILILIIIIIIYFLPTIIYFGKKDTKGLTFFIFNLLIGWTLIGWIILLFNAMMIEDPKKKKKKLLKEFINQKDK